MNDKHIVIITTGGFPDGDAGSVRIFMTAKALILKGYKVTVLCRGKVNDAGESDGVKYISLRNGKGRLTNAIDHFAFSGKVKRYLNSVKADIYGIYIYYGVKVSLFEFCKELCRKNNIRLFFDCVEWFSPESCRRGEKDKTYITINKINSEIVDKSCSVIAISRYLEEYFSSKGISTLRVPVLCDSQTRTSPKVENSEKLTLFYAGSPFKKDLVGNVLKAVPLLEADERKKLQIVFVGTTRKYLENESGIPSDVIDACSDVLELCGRVSRSEVLRRMERSDFVLLPRDAELRYAKAGFPSKVVEALANATPIFCNISSDLGEFLVDGENAVIAESHLPEDIANAIKRAIKLTPEQKNCMSKKALETARENFDYRLYAEKLDNFFGRNH